MKTAAEVAGGEIEELSPFGRSAGPPASVHPSRKRRIVRTLPPRKRSCLSSIAQYSLANASIHSSGRICRFAPSFRSVLDHSVLDHFRS